MDAASRKRVFALFAAAALVLAPAARGKVRVAVDFDIDAGKYRRNLHKELGTVEGKLEQALAEIGNETFGFLAWIPGHPASGLSTLSATLHAHVVDGVSGTLGPSIWLKLSAEPGAAKMFDCGSKRPVAVQFERIGAVRLFSGSEPQSGNAEDLERRVRGVLLHHFGNGGFGQRFARTFLNRIPICDRVEIPFPSFPRHIALNVDRNELRLDSRARMALRPCSQFPGEPEVYGEINLALTEVSVGSSSLVQTRVVSCYVPPREGEACIEAIPRILQHRLSERVDVFMRQYVWIYEGTDGRRATVP